jgi:hypothetical protein
MSLEHYEDARRWARSIRREVLARRMPPWPAAEGVGDFKDARHLTPLEIQLLAAWVDGGSPSGPSLISAAVPRTEPPPASLTLTVPSTSSGESVQLVEVPTHLAADAWIVGWLFESSLERPVRQLRISSLRSGEPVGTWVAPDALTTFPAGVAQRLPARDSLVLQLTYAATTVAPAASPAAHTLKLYLAQKPDRPVHHLVRPCGQTQISRRMLMLAISPRLQDGASFEAVARTPDGSIQPLLWIRHYVSPYELTYRLRIPTSLPPGTTLFTGSSKGECTVDLSYVHG